MGEALVGVVVCKMFVFNLSHDQKNGAVGARADRLPYED